MGNANYRKHNDRTLNSSTYHKKDGTNVRAKLKVEKEKEKELEEFFEWIHEQDGCPHGQPGDYV